MHEPTRGTTVRQNESETTQKIFHANGRGIEMACIVYGEIADITRLFDASIEVQRLIKAQGARDFANPYDYVWNMCVSIAGVIERLKDRGTIDVRPKLNLHLVGYAGDKPCAIDAEFHRFYDLPGRFFDVRSDDYMYPGRCYVVGSMLIGRLINTGDPRLSHYARPITESMSLNDAVDFCKGYVEACASPIAMQIDPEINGRVGGRIHIASVTPDKGFKWILSPKKCCFFRSAQGS
jgi:hypothetical protein